MFILSIPDFFPEIGLIALSEPVDSLILDSNNTRTARRYYLWLAIFEKKLWLSFEALRSYTQLLWLSVLTGYND